MNCENMNLERIFSAVQKFIPKGEFKFFHLGTEKNMVHVCYGVCFRMERTVRRDSGDEFCQGGWEAVVI